MELFSEIVQKPSPNSENVFLLNGNVIEYLKVKSNDIKNWLIYNDKSL